VSSLDFANGQGILMLGAGAAPTAALSAAIVWPMRTGMGAGHPVRQWGNDSISGWSAANSITTIRTNSAHNLPLTRYSNGQLYSQRQ
jgi:hypothetical protein